MANKKTSDYDAVVTIADSYLFDLAQASVKNFKATAAEVKSYVLPTAIQETLTISTPGQTAFTLSATPNSVAGFKLYLNGQLRESVTDYTFSGTALTWNDPGGLTLLTTDLLVACYNDAAGGQLVTSVFGRNGAVIAAASDYDASQVDNDSGVSGAFVSDALDTLSAAIPTVPVDSVFTRTGAVTAAASDYDASQIDNDSGVTGAFVSDALDTLDAAIPANSYTVLMRPETNANTGNHRTRSIGAGGAFNLEFAIPDDFSSLISLEVIMSPRSGATGTGKDVDLTSDYGAITELNNQHTEADTTSTYDFGSTINALQAIDISGVFSALSAGDVCGVNWDNNGVGGTIDIYQIKLVYAR